VNAVLAGAPNPPEKTRLMRIVLVAGPKDHGPGEHDYPAWQKAWSELMGAADKVEIATAWEWPDRAEFQKADVMVFFQRGSWDANRSADIDAFLARGGGAVYIHWAVDGQKDSPGFAKRIGLSWGNGSKFRHGPVELAFNLEAKHPIARNFGKLSLVDESYWDLTGELPKGRIIASAVEDKQPRPLFWSLEQGRGRVFVSIPGHYSWSFDDPLFRVLLLRGIAWSGHEPVDRFNDLVWPGADVTKP
jgi:type 1 glutamine amidotransferase